MTTTQEVRIAVAWAEERIRFLRYIGGLVREVLDLRRALAEYESNVKSLGVIRDPQTGRWKQK